MRKMGALKSKIKITWAVFFIGTLALSGIPPFAGFFSKDEILWSAYSSGTAMGKLLFVLGLAGAFMTAFYSFRLIYLTFYGSSRLDHEVAHHVHESPRIMTVPLMILAFFSVTIGFVGMPLIEHGNLFASFLAPLFPHAQHAAEAESHSMEIGLMLLSVMVAAAGWRLASSFYNKQTPVWPGRLAETFKGTYTLLLNKYRVDEFYNAIFVDGLVHKLAKFLYSIGDVKIIDGFINSLAAAIGETSERGRKFQTGYVQQYAFTMGAGLAVLVGLYYVLK
jgi:NADH-quinone oxidoreductase subunit L